MATDPQSLLVGLIGTTGLGQGIADQEQNTALAQQGAQQQLVAGQQQLTDHALAQQSAEQFQRDVLAYNQNPSPQALSSLAMRYPQQAQNFTAAAKLKDDAQRNADLTSYGQIYNAASNGRKDLVLQQLQQRQAAMRGAGQDTANIDDAIQQLNTGGDDALKNVKGIALAQIYGHDPDGFTKAFNLNDDGAHFKSTGDNAIYDDRTGELVRQGVAKPEYKIVKRGDGGEDIVQVGGGGQTSTAGGAGGGSAGPVSGRTTGGWTPRTRNGGDNPDAAVDSKIAGAAKALGVDPDADISKQSPMQIAQAMTISEGGKGSLADRNNNPANLRNGDGSYKKFPTKEAGLAAAAALVARKLARGQTSVRSMIEGLPAGGANAGPIASPSGGGGQVVYSSQGAPAGGGEGALDPDTRKIMAQQYLQGDKTVFTNLGRGRQGAANVIALRKEISDQARAQGMTGGQIAQQMQTFNAAQRTLNAFDAGKEGGITRSLNVAIDHLDTLQNAAQALQNGNIPMFNAVSQGWAKATGSAAPTNFEATRQIVAGEVAKVIAGGNSALADRKELIDHIKTSASPQQLAGYVAQAKQLLAGQLHGLAQQYQTGTGRNDFSTRLSPRTRVALGYGAQGAASHFSHMSASGKFGWDGSKWVAVH